MLNVKMQDKNVQSLSPKITVIGVGGAGGNAVNNMIASNLEGCEFMVCNTDAQALGHSLCDNKIQLGEAVTGGLGAGSKPEVGQAAAEESLDDVMQFLDGANMAFVTAGMGGGTGTGAAPVIAKACRERGILTVGVVTKPFHFEGSHRMQMAEAGIKEMQQYVDTLIVIPNQNLFRVASEKTTFAEGFKMADSVLQSGVRGVTDLMVRPGLVNLDFADIRTAMLEMGKAMMGTGEASGEKRAIEAAEAAINNPLLDDVTMKGARGVIINVTGGYDMTLFEADEACNRIRDEVDANANIIFGATFDEKLEGTMRVSIVATGIEREAALRGRGGDDVKGTLERAVPVEEKSEEKSEEKASAPSRAYKTGVDNLRGITAPTSLAEKPLEAPAVPKDDDAELMDQARYAEVEATDQASTQNTALRGMRYKDSFIPPKPVTVAPAEKPAEVAESQPAPVSFPSAPVKPVVQAQPAAGSKGLVLNPPKPSAPAQDEPKTQSFFERLAGTVKQSIDDLTMRDEAEAYHAPAPQPRRVSSPSIGGAATAPAQGQLNIEEPAAPPKQKQQADDLDIPAFLRRQAN